MYRVVGDAASDVVERRVRRPWARAGGYLQMVNPLTRLALMFILTTPLLLSIDWVSATVSLVLTLLLAPVAGISYPQLWRLAWPLMFIAPLSGISMLLYGAPGGIEYFSFWLITVTSNSIELAIAMVIRVFAVALPVIILARNIEPTSLGDALGQILKLPERFVLGAVAGVRTVSLFKDDWASMERARRARGLGDDDRLKHFATMAFGLLVLAIRRGGKLSTAMEARGFGRAPVYGDKRTWARKSEMKPFDWRVIGFSVLIAAIPVVVSVGTGAWRFLGL